MTQSKHTPAPWVSAHRKNDDGMYRTQVFTEDGETIATLHWYLKDLGNGGIGTYRECNANLIAAAPELLEALEYQMEVLRMGHDDIFEPNERKKHERAARLKMQKAIAKATGLK